MFATLIFSHLAEKGKQKNFYLLKNRKYWEDSYLSKASHTFNNYSNKVRERSKGRKLAVNNFRRKLLKEIFEKLLFFPPVPRLWWKNFCRKWFRGNLESLFDLEKRVDSYYGKYFVANISLLVKISWIFYLFSSCFPLGFKRFHQLALPKWKVKTARRNKLWHVAVPLLGSNPQISVFFVGKKISFQK